MDRSKEKSRTYRLGYRRGVNKMKQVKSLKVNKRYS